MEKKYHMSSTDCDENNKPLALQDRLFLLLSPFHFENMVLLRKVMRCTGMVISGSMALALIHPQQFIPNDIDFYVLPYGFPAVLKFIENHGYEISPERGNFDYIHLYIIVVKLIHRKSRKTVNVITGFNNHVVKLIICFHSTVVMNYLSWFGLVILYPEWTLRKSGLIVRDAADCRNGLTKYVDRGYTLCRDVSNLRQPSQEQVCQSKSDCTHFIHDGHWLSESNQVQLKECVAKYIKSFECGCVLRRDVFEVTTPLKPHVCRLDPYCPLTTRSLHDGNCVVEAFEAGFDIVAGERDMTWVLPVSCSFNNFPSNAEQ